MRYREYLPGPALRGVVHRFWTLRGEATDGPADFQRAMPDGRPELIFNLADRFEARRGRSVERQPLALLVGPTTRALLVRPTGRIDLVGIRLVPGRWPELLGLPAGEVLDRAVALPEASRHWREDLLEPLSEADDDRARVELLSARLHRAVSRERGGDRRLQQAVDLTVVGGVRRVTRLAELAGVSERHLGRLFRAGTGIGPRLMARLAGSRCARRPGAAVPVWWTSSPTATATTTSPIFAVIRPLRGTSPGRYLAASRELTRHFVDGAGSPA
jgi:hypothetical protein